MSQKEQVNLLANRVQTSPIISCKLTHVNVSRASRQLASPHDKWKIVFSIFVLHGLGTLMPWNMFITAKNYFVDFKLDNPGVEELPNHATNFLQYLGFASQIPNLLFNWLNIFLRFGGNLTKRIVFSILLEIAVFVGTVILAMLNSSSWPGLFFWITMLSVVCLNMANGIYQNTVYGLAARLPVKYTGAVVLGSNMSGLFATVISISSSFVFTSQRTSAIYYFVNALFILLICLDTYFALSLNIFFRHYALSGGELAVEEKSVPPYWKIFKQAFSQLFNIFFTFFVTLAIFPAVHSDIKRLDKTFFITESQFTAITCFLTFNLFAMIGSFSTTFVQWPKPKYLTVAVTLRAIFLPVFLFCNYLPKGTTRILPILIRSDWVYWMISTVMSFSSGYLSALGMMYAPQTVCREYQVIAGMFAAAMLVTGIFAGIVFSMIFPILVGTITF